MGRFCCNSGTANQPPTLFQARKPNVCRKHLGDGMWPLPLGHRRLRSAERPPTPCCNELLAGAYTDEVLAARSDLGLVLGRPNIVAVLLNIL